jgi:Flp pilus assembly protein TadD
MPTTEELLDEGLGHHQAGRLAEAERLYQEVLRVDPRHANALHLLGLVYHQQGQHDAAIGYVRRAIDVQPRSELFWENLGAVYHALGRYREAADAAGQLLQLNPNNGKAYFNLGCALRDLGDLDGAGTQFRRATEINPSFADAFFQLGNTLNRLGEPAEASNCLGVALHAKGKLDEAAGHFRNAVKLNPRYAEAYKNLGIVLVELGEQDEATGCFRKALEVAPNDADAHIHLGVRLLQLGDFEAGWAHYEWRCRSQNPAFKPRNFSAPLWDGRPLGGKTLLMHAEQGLGDTLQFVRYAPLVRRRDGRVVLGSQKPLRILLSGCPGIDQVVVDGEQWPPFDCHVPLLSLPHLLGTQADNFPADVPYLFAREDLIRLWQGRLGDCPGFKVGICWQGDPRHRDDRRRSFTLSHFAALAEIPDVDLISLQKGTGTEQLAAVRFPVKALGPDFDEGNGPFMDTAAVMKNLDLVVTSDTAVAHLAGALGVPVWVALAKAADWRWQLDREDSPWYPTMRLFRQEQAGDWGLVFQRIAGALRE